MRIAINGFGRIGRLIFRIAFDRGANIVAINDLHGAENSAYLLKHDTVYGRYNRKISAKDGNLIVDGKRIRVLSERDPYKLPWKKLGVDLVVESTGVFRDRLGASSHLGNGVKYVIITAPANDPDITVVPGVNHAKLKKNHRIVSVASCTTNCLVPMVKVLHDKFQVQRAFFTTAHAYTNDQALHDSSHKKHRRGRAAAQNMVPTTTGASKSVTEIMPELLGRINGLAVRVPVVVGSLVDLTVEVRKKASANRVNSVFKKAAEGKLKGIIEFSNEELVSSDIIANSHSCVFDSLLTQTTGNLVKVLAWYDNEWGYSNRVVDVMRIIKKWAR
jgi:glyceraldehyde-3-phosphate dehydrogenase type I